MLKDRKNLKKRGNENMKKFRKVIVALLAMVMALGCLTVAASAAEYKDSGKLYIIGSFDGWKEFKEMTGKDGVYTCEMDLVAGTAYEFKFTVDNKSDWSMLQISADGGDYGADGNFKYTPDADGKYKITIDTTKCTNGSSSKACNGKDAVTVAPATAAPGAGVSAPVVAAAIAVISMVGIVVFTKRRTVAE